MEPIIQWITWKKCLLFTAVFGMLFVTINFTGAGVAGLQELTGGPGILDFQLGYSHSEAYELLAALGEKGRHFYLTSIMPLDFPFPLAYMLCYTGWMALLIKPYPHKPRMTLLFLLPLLAMGFDWIENLGIIAMLRGYPDLPRWAVWMASTAGIAKAVCIVGSVGVIAMLAIYAAQWKYKSRLSG